jgi:hypothetical protein
MKNSIKIILCLLFISQTSFSQINGAISTTFGIVNPKLRIQYEKPINYRSTFGANINYYFVNWKGPKIDLFARLYSKKDGNEEGNFLQAKLGYGNLSTLDFNEDYMLNSRWSTFGIGLAGGKKFILGDNFIIESLLGFHIYSSPSIDYISGYDEVDYAIELGEDIGWFLTTGFPVDFQLKFGYQF